MKRDEPELATLLGTLGRLFVAGAAIDWSAVYPAGNLVKLPAYPWQRQRFWMVSAATGRGSSFTGGHPLAGEAQRTGGDDRIWTAAISGELHPWLKDHVVGEAALLPASAYLEMAAAVCGSIFGGAVATIEELALTRAAVVPEAGAMQFQVIAAKETQDAYALTFYCRDSAAAEWDRAASAQIRKQAAASRALKADLREWQDAEFSDQATGGTQHSRRMAELGYSFGPAFCNLAWLSLDEERALARISNANLRSESYLIHPALLDAALQLLGRLLLEQSEDPKTLLPVSCARAEWFAAAVAGEALYARAVAALNELSGEVEVFGEDGRLLVRLSGFTFAPLARQAGESLDELIFELAWEPLDLSVVNGRRGQDASIAQWLVVSEDLDHGRRLVEALRGFDVHVDVLGPGEVLSIVSGGTGSREIVWFVSAQSQRSRRSALDDVLNQMSQLAEAIAALDRGEEGLSQTRLCVVTRGTQAVADEDVTSVFEAGLWGFVASAQNEYPQLKTLCIDLPETALESEPDAVAEILLRGGDEKKIALRVHGAFVPRLVPGVTAACEGGLIPASELRSFPTGVTEGFDLVQTVPGTINSFGLFTSWTEPPCEGEVQIQVRAAGLNFRDVLRVMGLNEAISASQIGGECAGVVLRTGTGVRNFAPGDEVLAMSPSFYAKGMFASCVNVPEVLVAKKPATMSFAEAAGIPCVFVTAWYSLVNLARLQPGERVLIHAAAGGVGLAAIQVAKWIGSEIFATVGSEEKREYLRGLGVTRIMNSRTLDFTREILEATGGQGVDVVLNSLAGPAIAAGLEALAPYGRFVEIGKRDIWENGRIGLKPFQKNLSLYAVDLSQTVEDRRSLVGSMLTKIMEHMASGDLKPVKTETFPVSAAGDAFQLMANAGHIGKIALDLRNPSAMIHRDRSKLDPSATYLITGGTGGLGLTTAKTFVRHGARHLVLSARTAPGESVRGAIREMEKGGRPSLLAPSGRECPDRCGGVAREDSFDHAAAGRHRARSGSAGRRGRGTSYACQLCERVGRQGRRRNGNRRVPKRLRPGLHCLLRFRCGRARQSGTGQLCGGEYDAGCARSSSARARDTGDEHRLGLVERSGPGGCFRGTGHAHGDPGTSAGDARDGRGTADASAQVRRSTSCGNAIRPDTVVRPRMLLQAGRTCLIACCSAPMFCPLRTRVWHRCCCASRAVRDVSSWFDGCGSRLRPCCGLNLTAFPRTSPCGRSGLTR